MTYKNRTFEESALCDLIQLIKIAPLKPAIYKRTVEIIKRDAQESKHMRVYQFVDLCILLAGINEGGNHENM